MMRVIEDSERAVEAVAEETTALAFFVDEIQRNLEAAAGDPKDRTTCDSLRVIAEARRLAGVSARLRAMATPAESGGVLVPVTAQSLTDAEVREATDAAPAGASWAVVSAEMKDEVGGA